MNQNYFPHQISLLKPFIDFRLSTKLNINAAPEARIIDRMKIIIGKLHVSEHDFSYRFSYREADGVVVAEKTGLKIT